MFTPLILSAALLSQDAAASMNTSGTVLPPAVQAAITPAQAPAPATAQSGSAVSVDAYHRDYEGPKSAQELNFDTGILQAYSARENQVGSLEGSWVISGPDGRKLVGLELRSDHAISSRLEGAWRSMLAGIGMAGSGFVSDISLTGRDLEVNYFADGARSPTILHLHKDGDGQWRGSLMDTLGRKTKILMTQVGVGG